MTLRRPTLTVDVIIAGGNGMRVVLVKRKNPPAGWALPGGFVDYGETIKAAAVREAKEETNLDIKRLRLFGVYSDPRRDARGHMITVVYRALGTGALNAADDALDAAFFEPHNLPAKIAFDHGQILTDYFSSLGKHRTLFVR